MHTKRTTSPRIKPLTKATLPLTRNKSLHPNNQHNQGYDFVALIAAYPALSPFVIFNKVKQYSIDFADPVAVKTLNAALLAHHYQIVGWDIPDGFLCPPIPGRVDYVHHVADLFSGSEALKTQSNPIRLLDIGIGANGIYSLLASRIYGWHCTGSDVNQQAVDNVRKILKCNPTLQGLVDLRLQSQSKHVFHGIILPGEYFDVCVCNPPFHASAKEAADANQRKRDNLAINREKRQGRMEVQKAQKLNFGGQQAELWCHGGEAVFLQNMISESKPHANQCGWFTCLVSKSEHLSDAKKQLRSLNVAQIKEITMRQGNKITRILAWTYFKPHALTSD